MKNYKITMAYEGRRYKGFKATKGDDPDKSIQGKLENVLGKLYGSEIEIVAAVNTATGVDAEKQVAHFKVEDDRFAPAEIRDYLETYLPEDIITYAVEEADEKFHSQYQAKAITYRYRLWKKEAPRRPLKERGDVKVMDQHLDVPRMKEGAELFRGEHDFRAFTNNRKVKNPVKSMERLTIEETEREIIITMTANQFLLNMERFVVGTLVEIGLGQKEPDTISKAFKSYNEKNVGHKSMAGGLCLLDILY